MSAGFCGACGAPLEARLPEGDARVRRVCTDCAEVHFENPAVQAGVIAVTATGTQLRLQALQHGEKLQAAALRALGTQMIGEARLALYCALSDLDADVVVLVFRLASGVRVAAATVAQPPLPGWAAALLHQYHADEGRGAFPVYAGSHENGRFSIEAVPEEECRA